MPHKIPAITLVSLTLIGFLAIVGMWWMGPHAGSDHICIAAMVTTADCPMAATDNSSLFHVQSFHQFTSNFLPVVAIAIAALAILFAACALQQLLRDLAWRSVIFPLHAVSASPPVISDGHSWLAIHEHSPSALP